LDELDGAIPSKCESVASDDRPGFEVNSSQLQSIEIYPAIIYGTIILKL
jgi:hypothetical protein